MVQNGRIGGHIERTPARAKLPHKVIARFDDCLRLADVLGALLLWVQLGSTARLALRRQRRPQVGHGRPVGFGLVHQTVVRKLQIEERILERVRPRVAVVDLFRQPAGGRKLRLLNSF